jgi:hypothetical protein
MANFNAIAAAVNGQLDDGNIADAANINQAKITAGYPPSKLGNEGALQNQGLIWDQTNARWTPQYSLPSAQSKTGTQIQIINTTVETAIVSFPVPANLLGTNKCLLCRVGIGMLNSTGSNQTVQWRVKYGSTTLLNTTSGYAGSNQMRAGVFSTMLSPLNSTISQRLYARMIMSQDPAAAGAAGFGDLTQSGGARTFSGSSSENSATTLTFSITIQFATASNNLFISRGWYWAAIFA